MLEDGTLDFVTTAGSGFSTVTDLQLDQANLGTSTQSAVDANVAFGGDPGTDYMLYGVSYVNNTTGEDLVVHGADSFAPQATVSQRLQQSFLHALGQRLAA